MLGKKYSIGICFSNKKSSDSLDYYDAKNPCKNKKNRGKSITALLSNCHANNDRNHSNTPAIFKYNEKIEHVSNVWVCSIEESFLGLGKNAGTNDIKLYPGFLKLFKGRKW